MDLKDIKAIIDLMKKNSIGEFDLEKPDFKIRLKRGGNGVAPSVPTDDTTFIPAQMMTGTASQVTVPAAPPPLAPMPISNEQEIKSPMIGTGVRQQHAQYPAGRRMPRDSLAGASAFL